MERNLWGVNISSVKLGNIELDGDLSDAFIDSGSTFIHLKDNLFGSFIK